MFPKEKFNFRLSTNTSPVSLDNATAKHITRTKIDLFTEEHTIGSPEFRMKMNALSTKRLAWIRGAGKLIRDSIGSGLIYMTESKRKLGFVSLAPHRNGLDVMLGRAVYPGRVNGMTLAFISEHAIARLLERAKTTDPLVIIKKELLSYTVAILFELKDLDQAPDDVLIPTETGVFFGVRDKDIPTIIAIKSWLPQRLMNDTEIGILKKLRTNHSFGLGPKLDNSLVVKTVDLKPEL